MAGAFEGAAVAKVDAPDPDDPRKPGRLRDLRGPHWRYVVRDVVRKFLGDQATDLAAGLTYFGVLALVPALLTVVSMLGLVGEADSTMTLLTQLSAGLLPAETVDAIGQVIQSLRASHRSRLALAIGLVGALWSSSGYVGALGRALNRIYEVDEGRPWWWLRPVHLLVALFTLVTVALTLLGLVLSGPLARMVARAFGMGNYTALAMEYGRWPVLGIVALILLAVIYYTAPNVRQPHFRWLSPGAGLAIVCWLLMSLAFAAYVSRFGQYNRTYGTLAGVIVLLLWLWLANLALLLGAEIDAAIERLRQLQAGIAAEEQLQLPPRSSRVSRQAVAQREKRVAAGRRIRDRYSDPSVWEEEYPDIVRNGPSGTSQEGTHPDQGPDQEEPRA